MILSSLKITAQEQLSMLRHPKTGSGILTILSGLFVIDVCAFFLVLADQMLKTAVAIGNQYGDPSVE